jgi:hypothetical protein
MAVTIDATVGGPNSNSYPTLEEAEAYFATRMPAPTKWAATPAPSNDDKSKALITATRITDLLADWKGSVASDTQARMWPRDDMEESKGLDMDNDIIPDELKYAIYEFAEVLLGTDKTVDLSSMGLSELGVGPIKIKFSDNAPPVRKVLPDITWDYIKRWCNMRLDSNRGSARLVRG